MRLTVSGGAPVPPTLKRALRDELKLPLAESYGQSELGGFMALGDPILVSEDKFGAAMHDERDEAFEVRGGEHAGLVDNHNMARREGPTSRWLLMVERSHRFRHPNCRPDWRSGSRR